MKTIHLCIGILLLIPSSPLSAENRKPGCLEMVNQLCQMKFDPTHQGNLTFHMGQPGGSPKSVKNGKAPNGMPYPLYFFFIAQKTNWEKLPPPFRQALEKVDYLSHLEALLSGQLRKSKAENTKKWLNAVWTKAYQAIQKKHLIPQREFQHSVYGALWSHHPGWKNVQETFTRVRNEYLGYLQEQKTIPEGIKKEWLATVASVQLTAPWDLDSERLASKCSKGYSNAFYLPKRHTLTVCSGHFTTLDGLDSTIAHELSHSLGLNRSKFQFIKQSLFGKKLTQLWADACSNKKDNSCSSQWAVFRAEYLKLLRFFDQFQLPSRHLRSCLQYNQAKLRPFNLKEIPPQEARTQVRKALSKIADRRGFYQLVSKYELNPCKENEAPQDPTDSTLGLFFVMEYRCLGHLSEVERFRRSIQVAADLETHLIARKAVMGGSMANSTWMLENQYSESSEERFADALGYRVFARLLSKQQDLEARRQEFLLNEAKFCKKDDLSDPDLIQAEHEFSLEPHSFGQQRRIENLVPEIRTLIDCQKDFERQDCTL